MDEMDQTDQTGDCVTPPLSWNGPRQFVAVLPTCGEVTCYRKPAGEARLQRVILPERAVHAAVEATDEPTPERLAGIAYTALAAIEAVRPRKRIHVAANEVRTVLIALPSTERWLSADVRAALVELLLPLGVTPAFTSDAVLAAQLMYHGAMTGPRATMPIPGRARSCIVVGAGRRCCTVSGYIPGVDDLPGELRSLGTVEVGCDDLAVFYTRTFVAASGTEPSLSRAYRGVERFGGTDSIDFSPSFQQVANLVRPFIDEVAAQQGSTRWLLCLHGIAGGYELFARSIVRLFPELEVWRRSLTPLHYLACGEDSVELEASAVSDLL